MKKCLILILLLSLIPACSASSNGKSEAKNNKTSIEKQTDKYEIVNRFIELCNNKYNIPISDIGEMDIQGTDYKTEFRLQAYDGAVGKKGYIDGYKIEMVNYGVWNNDSFRIYLEADSFENATTMFKQLIKVFDNSITDTEIDEKLNSSSLKSINFNFNEKNYLTSYIEDKNVFIDTTEIKF